MSAVSLPVLRAVGVIGDTVDELIEMVLDADADVVVDELGEFGRRGTRRAAASSLGVVEGGRS